MWCCVASCRNRNHDHRGNRIPNGLRFFSFPAWKQTQGPQVSDLTKRRRMAWVAAVRRDNVTFNHIPRHMSVCSRHFHSGKPAYEMLEHHPDWVPSLHLGHTEVRDTQTETVNQTTKGQRVHIGNITVFPAALAPSGPRAQMDEAAVKDDTGEQQECSLCSHRRAEVLRLQEENRLLKEELSQKKMEEHSFKDDDVKVKYYTGLPCFAVVMAVLAQLLPRLPQTVPQLSPFQMLLLTLMRLRLNLPVQHIAYLFCVDHKTVSTTFRDTIGVMFTHFSPLVHWPERPCVQGTMPHQFVEAFGSRVAVILDCFEMKIERPLSLEDEAQTFSYNKHKDTKYLIGITPQGAICFISKGWGGRVSDKQLTEDSGLLNKLLPGDLVLADRGFDISDSVGLMCAEVKTPTSTGGRCQLDAKDVEETQKIAHLRVHVERVVGCLRKFMVLSETIPLSETTPLSTGLPCEHQDRTFLDKIVTVCCALTNMCPSVVVIL